MKKQITYEEAKERLASLCSRSEQCEFELNRKMINWGLPSSKRNEIIEFLRENRFVDDNRFARSYANDKSKFAAWGPFKIKMELVKRRISGQIITEVLRNIRQDVWKEGLLKNAMVKSKNLDLLGEEGWDNRQKLFRYLISRGFPSSAASKAVNVIKKRQEIKEC